MDLTKKTSIAITIAAILLLSTISPVLANQGKDKELQRVIFIHKAKPDKESGGNEDDNGFYKLINGGIKWEDLPVKIEVNPDNPSGLDSDKVVNIIHIATEEWDDGAYSGWGGVTPDLFDNTVTTTDKGYGDLAWTSDKLDGYNTIVWGDYPTEGVIAVTIVWYYVTTKEIIEFDIVLDIDFECSLDAPAEEGKQMDLQNIITHELGHGVGLDDLYQPKAYQETMYGYADYDEIIKRDLYVGDQEGITKLYG